MHSQRREAHDVLALINRIADKPLVISHVCGVLEVAWILCLQLQQGYITGSKWVATKISVLFDLFVLFTMYPSPCSITMLGHFILDVRQPALRYTIFYFSSLYIRV